MKEPARYLKAAVLVIFALLFGCSGDSTAGSTWTDERLPEHEIVEVEPRPAEDVFDFPGQVYRFETIREVEKITKNLYSIGNAVVNLETGSVFDTSDYEEVRAVDSDRDIAILRGREETVWLNGDELSILSDCSVLFLNESPSTGFWLWESCPTDDLDFPRGRRDVYRFIEANEDGSFSAVSSLEVDPSLYPAAVGHWLVHSNGRQNDRLTVHHQTLSATTEAKFSGETLVIGDRLFILVAHGWLEATQDDGQIRLQPAPGSLELPVSNDSWKRAGEIQFWSRGNSWHFLRGDKLSTVECDGELKHVGRATLKRLGHIRFSPEPVLACKKDGSLTVMFFDKATAEVTHRLEPKFVDVRTDEYGTVYGELVDGRRVVWTGERLVEAPDLYTNESYVSFHPDYSRIDPRVLVSNSGDSVVYCAGLDGQKVLRHLSVETGVYKDLFAGERCSFAASEDLLYGISATGDTLTWAPLGTSTTSQFRAEPPRNHPLKWNTFESRGPLAISSHGDVIYEPESCRYFVLENSYRMPSVRQISSSVGPDMEPFLDDFWAISGIAAGHEEKRYYAGFFEDGLDGAADFGPADAVDVFETRDEYWLVEHGESSDTMRRFEHRD